MRDPRNRPEKKDECVLDCFLQTSIVGIVKKNTLIYSAYIYRRETLPFWCSFGVPNYYF